MCAVDIAMDAELEPARGLETVGEPAEARLASNGMTIAGCPDADRGADVVAFAAGTGVRVVTLERCGAPMSASSLFVRSGEDARVASMNTWPWSPIEVWVLI